MSCSIFKNNEEVFCSSVGVFESLYHEMKDIVDQEKVKTNNEFDRFMEEMDEILFTLGGTLIDIQELFTQSKNLDVLLMLLNRTIDILTPQVREYVVEDLWKLHGELITYKEELVAQGK